MITNEHTAKLYRERNFAEAERISRLYEENASLRAKNKKLEKKIASLLVKVTDMTAEVKKLERCFDKSRTAVDKSGNAGLEYLYGNYPGPSTR